MLSRSLWGNSLVEGGHETGLRDRIEPYLSAVVGVGRKDHDTGQSLLDDLTGGSDPV